MAKLILNSVLLIALFLIATASISLCAEIVVIGRNLTCSNPSPMPPAPALSGANVTLFCMGVPRGTINTTTTDAAGNFTMTYNGFISPFILPLLSCRVFINVPANCTIRRAFGRVTTLISGPLFPTFEARPVVYEATVFTAN